ncbi:MAG: hypothetical protein QE265_12415 [Rhodoferax sp.]|nr:hypothetical protein [Rhodoferax sp.]
MNVFPIPDALEAKYHGAGYALAASVNGQLVDVVYLRDAVPAFGELDEPGPDDVQAVIDKPELAPTVRKLQALGLVHVGMCSGWTFTEL